VSVSVPQLGADSVSKHVAGPEENESNKQQTN